jgi:hypothetical protein
MNQISNNTTAGSGSGGSHCSIFELVDTTDEETYYTMGLFETAEEAIRLASREGSCPPCNEIGEDYVTMEIRKRRVGKIRWSETGQVVATVRWVRKYSDEDEDDGKWAFSISTDGYRKKGVSEVSSDPLQLGQVSKHGGRCPLDPHVRIYIP